jgi:hypothetical protein
MTLALPLRRLLSGIASPQNASHRTHHIVAFVIHAIASFVKDIPPRYRLSANIKVARKNAPTTIPKNGAPSVRHATSIKMKSASITPPKNGTKFMKQKLSSYVNLHLRKTSTTTMSMEIMSLRPIINMGIISPTAPPLQKSNAITQTTSERRTIGY